MLTPTSQSASVSASRRRAAYGAPDAPVTPRKTRTCGSVSVPLRSLLPAARGVQERGDRLDLRRGELIAESRHHGVAELARVGDVIGEPLNAAAARALAAELGSPSTRAAARPSAPEMGRAEVQGAGAQVRVALLAACLGEQLCARQRP